MVEHCFHSGEASLQTKVGVREDAMEIARAGIIRDYMPGQHRKFYSEQNLLFVSSTAEDEFDWCSILHGQQGFVQSPMSANILTFPINCISPRDPLDISVGSRIGMFGLEFHTRRRNRANGVVIASSSKDFTIQIEQTTGNCPKCIQIRQIMYTPPKFINSEDSKEILAGNESLSTKQLNIIKQADTFFLATSGSVGKSSSSLTMAMIALIEMEHLGLLRYVLK